MEEVALDLRRGGGCRLPGGLPGVLPPRRRGGVLNDRPSALTGRLRRERPALDAPLLASLLGPPGAAGGAEGSPLRTDHDHDPHRLAHRATRHTALLPPNASRDQP